MRKKIFALAIVALMLAMTAAGCADSGTSTPAPAPAGDSSTGGAPAGDAPTGEQMTFTASVFDLPEIAESSDEFTIPGERFYDDRWKVVLDKFNARIDFNSYAYGTALEQFRQMVNGGAMPDTIVCYLGASEGLLMAEEGMLGLLPAGFEENYPNLKKMLDMIPVRENFQINGQYFCIPRALESAEPYVDYDQAIYYRKDLAEAAGVEIKDYYSIDELYEMYEKVQAQNPDMVMYSDIWPEDIRKIGLSEAIPNIFPGRDWYRKDGGEYVYAWAQPETLEGIMTFKKFFDAGFLRQEFFNDAQYVARDEFSAGQVFSYYDGLGIDFYNNVLDRFKAANPDVAPEDAVACAWISVLDDKLLGFEGTNTWSELYFSPEVVQDPEKLDKILSIYDYLHSPEARQLQNYGVEGIHFEYDADGNIQDIREKDPATGLSVPFNADPSVPDIYAIVLPGAFADSTDLAANPTLSQYAKDEYRRLMDIRKDPANLHILPYDNDITTFQGERYIADSVNLKPIDVVYRIIFENDAAGVPAAWEAWLSENQETIDRILEEVNAALPG